MATTDIAAAREFYERVLQLRVIDESNIACVFDVNGTMLRLTPVAELLPAPYTVLGWRVTDITAAVRELTGRGIEFIRYDVMDQDDLGIWSTPHGDRVAWFRDPDGNVLSVSQFVQQPPAD